MKTDKVITLEHGAGGEASRALVNKLVLKYFKNNILARLDDAAALEISAGKIAFTTDGYVVNPIFFDGGNIGDIALCGTVNDLSVKGAAAKYISLALIIEEGFKLADLERIFKSIAARAHEAGVRIVTGDTKVVQRGAADKIFINTSGVGEIIKEMSPDNIRAGDAVIVSGFLGEHGMAIMNARHNLGLKGLRSDVAPLCAVTCAVLPYAHMMRDLTRGSLTSSLTEIAGSCGFDIEIDAEKIPLNSAVKAACALLGTDPLQSANEGKLVCFAPAAQATKILKIMRAQKYGLRAALIGRVLKTKNKKVFIKTSVGARRMLKERAGENLPRLC
ncbi:MAG: hydrogenase expression/formation protein HypE [Elusimicrobium sp.]|jgi:hydrogenase expression/formation protein HypE|nr:hydrogenase expression/formation protein HypE [Elusimicrobium sp.]